MNLFKRTLTVLAALLLCLAIGAPAARADEPVLLSEEGVTISLTSGLRYEESFGAWEIYVRIENGNDYDVSVLADDENCLINGKPFAFEFGYGVGPKKSMNCGIGMPSAALEAIGVTDPTQIGSLTLGLTIGVSQDWHSLGTITLTPEDLAPFGAPAGPKPAPAQEEPAQEEEKPMSLVYDANGFRIYVTGSVVHNEKRNALEIGLFAENNTGEDLLLFNSLSSVSNVDGFTVGSDFYVDLKAGASGPAELLLYDWGLAQSGITDPEAIGSIVVTMVDGKTMKKLDTFTVTHADLYGGDAEAAGPAPAEGAQTLPAQVLGENKGVTLRLNGISADGQSLDVQLENAGTEPRAAVLENFVVNGWQLDAYERITARAGETKRVLVRLAEKVPGFAGFADISFTFRFYEPDTRYAGISLAEVPLEPLDKKDRAVALAPEPAAEIAYPPEEGQLLFDQKGVRLYCTGTEVDRSSSMVLSLLIVNESGKDADVGDVYTKKKVIVSLDGQKTDVGSLFGPVNAKAGARREMTVLLNQYYLGVAGVNVNAIRSIDANVALKIGGKTAVKSIAVHIDVN